MEQWILWGITLFGAIWWILIILARFCSYPFHEHPSHLVLLTENSQGTVEWVVRSFFFWNWIRGRRCRLICLDAGSADDTCDILRRLQRRYPDLEIHEGCRREMAGSALFSPDRGQAVLDLRRGRQWASVATAND